ncbi:hypothetical protein [Dyella psychrodurans]|uniref:hypothetical protein n=1 Tax=Dyella psychrodurans TaxID=1927960 RepID=UPI0018F6B1C1|nr:hypothetical protein [Dyella psychrodurans]
MEQIVECLIAGGPQHGLLRRQLWDPQYPAPPVVASGDGTVCAAAACRHAGSDRNRFLLVHPRATGQQILAMMMMLRALATNTVIAFPGPGGGPSRML